MPRKENIQLRHGTAAEWTSANPVLNLGELGVETDTGQLKIGNGSSHWLELAYSGGSAGGSLTAPAVGMVKSTGSSLAHATAGTDYAAPPTGSSLLMGDGSGGFSSATAGTDYAAPPPGSSLLKANGSGGFSAATAGTDYLVPGVLPATSALHLTTQGGNTLDNGSGRVTIVGGGTMDGVIIGSTTPSPSVNTGSLIQNHNMILNGTSAPWLNQVIGTSGSITGGGAFNKLWFSDAVVATDANYIMGLWVNQNIFAPAVGERCAIYGEVQVSSAGTNTAAQAGYVGVQGRGVINTGLGGTGLGLNQPIGACWGGWFAAQINTGTNMGGLYGIEIDVAANAGTSMMDKVGLGITMLPGDAVRGNTDDMALSVVRESGALTSWKQGIKFGSDHGSLLSTPTTQTAWPFASDSIMIGTSVAYSGDTLAAGVGIDFSQVTFSDSAIKTGAAPIQMAVMASAPSAPASGKGKLYLASDGLHFLGPNTDTLIAAM